MKSFVLRLDSGGIIGTPADLGIDSNEPVVRLTAEEAAKLGKLDHSHVVHARKLLKQAAEELGYDLKNIPELETDDDGDVEMSDAATSDTQTKDKDKMLMESPAVSSQRGDFVEKCLKVLDDTIKDLGKDATIFMAPVNPREAPDYFAVIKNPMDLGTIQKKLEDGEYECPRDFAEDVRLVWSNCSKYNKKGEYVEKIGSRGSSCFENHWAMSGLAEETRLKRLNAGRPAQKYEPEEPNNETPTLKNKTTKKKPKNKGEGDEASSRTQAQDDRPMSQEEMQHLANCLASVNGALLEDVIKIMKEDSSIDMPKEDSGEIELNMGTLRNKTLWKLDAFMKQNNVQPETEGVIVNKGSSSESSSSFGDSDTDSDESSKA